MEFVEEHAHSHPAMLDGYRALFVHVDQFERENPALKDVFFCASNEGAHCPEATRHHTRMGRLIVEGHVPLTRGGVPSGNDFNATWRVIPPSGSFPWSFSEMYPFTAEVPERFDRDAYE